MCLFISLTLLFFGVNMLLAGDYMMGIGASVTAIFFIILMVRHFIRVKKEQGNISAKDCLSCNTRK